MSIGNRRGRGHVVAPFLLVAVGHRPLPAHFAVRTADAQQQQVFLRVGARNEDRIVPNDRRRPAIARQRRDPTDGFRLAPFSRQIGFGGRTVEERSTPLRPVLGHTGTRQNSGQEQNN